MSEIGKSLKVLSPLPTQPNHSDDGAGERILIITAHQFVNLNLFQLTRESLAF